jgi:hypothetical protein
MADVFLSAFGRGSARRLGVVADRSGRPTHLLEKDVWVVWALATLYAAPLGEHLVFKGGTSLSKAYQVIRRFSEDVDLTYDIRAIAPDLVGDNGEGLPKTRSEEKRWSSEVRRRLPEWVAETVQPVIATPWPPKVWRRPIRVEDDRSSLSTTRRPQPGPAMSRPASCWSSARARRANRRACAMSSAMRPA